VQLIDFSIWVKSLLQSHFKVECKQFEQPCWLWSGRNHPANLNRTRVTAHSKNGFHFSGGDGLVSKLTTTSMSNDATNDGMAT
jgi:hypothetical protein